MKKRILFVGEDLTLAHVTRPMVLAESLDSAEYEISFATGERYRQFFKHVEFETHILSTLSSEIFLDRLAKGKPIFTRDEIQTSVKDDLNLFKYLKPDLVVGDFRLSLGISTQLAQIPYICLANAFWSPFSTLEFPLPELPIVDFLGIQTSKILSKVFLPLVLKFHVFPVNSVRKEYKLLPFKNIKEAYTFGDWTLYLDPPSLAPTVNLPANHLYIGPLLWSPDDPLPEWWAALPEDRPVIYVTLGSSGDIRSIKELILTLGNMPVSAVVSSAGRFTAEDLPDNIYVEPFLPGLKAAQRASVVVCSGGTATTYQALSCGTPVLGIPCNSDQYLSMEAIVRQGSGILIRAGQVNQKNFRSGIETLLKNRHYSLKAIQIKEEMEKYNSQKLFVAFIDSLVRKNII